MAEEEYKAVISAKFPSQKSAEAALNSLGTEKDMEGGRAKVRISRKNDELEIRVSSNDAASCRAALNGVLRLVELIKPVEGQK